MRFYPFPLFLFLFYFGSLVYFILFLSFVLNFKMHLDSLTSIGPWFSYLVFLIKKNSFFPFIFQGPDLVIHQTKECLDGMGEWCQSHHEASGKQGAINSRPTLYTS